ncbi:FecR family protein [Flavobacterium sp. AC]|uniref:FecR family protein n=2 Tax=Flavobacterium TaxID=237 RepID=A0ABT4WBB6_9FLAO|nr:FecR family protein [Flavobacterium azizsancarii]MDA6069527.1 FecR family protein [Flavobacterium azizsancarii]
MEVLILKFINNEASPEDIIAISNWLDQDVNHQKVFNDLIKTNYTVNCSQKTFNTDAAKKQFLQKIKEEKSVFFKARIRSYFKYAAIFIVFLSAFYLFKINIFFKATDTQAILREESITLQSENGSIQIINPINTQIITDNQGKVIGSQHKNKIVYAGELNLEKLVYNTISVPNGKRFELILSDGTSIQLNSGTSLKFPVNFVKGEIRQVFLNGEAYFDVTKDPRHPFLVSSSDMNVKVLGTKFNVTSYKNDAKTYTVLVEGKVAASDHLNHEEVILKPSERVYFEGKQLKVEPVNVRKYIAWISGELMFIDDSFAVITNKLERKYNVQIINNYEDLNSIIITATFKNENIDQVLKTFQTYKAFNYTINNRVITITEPKKM